MRVTIGDIAESLGIAPSTVSRALNGAPGVGDELRSKIAAAARERGYMPDSAARNLVKRTTSSVGLYVPRGLLFMMSNPFFAQVMEGISEVMDGLGYNYILATSPAQYRKLFRTHIVDGVVLFALRLGDPYVSELQSGGIPSVVVGSYNPMVDMPSVRPDDSQGMYDAVSYLVSRGHKRIALLNGPLSSFKSVACLDAYRKVLMENELDEDYETAMCGEFVAEWGAEGAKTLLKQDKRPTAIACANDLIAMGVCRAAHECGLRVPDDLSVIGFGDFPAASYMTPSLTTVHTPLREMGIEAARVLLALMKGGTESEYRKVFATSLMVRESVGDAR